MKPYEQDIYIRLSGEDMAISYGKWRQFIEVWIVGNLPHTVAAWISVLEKKKATR